MSFKAFVWAWDQALEKDEYLIVLLALADIANESGSLYASCAYIAKHARRNERTVRRALASMDGNVLTITERPGRTDLIRLNIPETFTVTFHREEEHEQGRRGRPKKTLAKVSENPGHGDEKPPPTVSDEPVLEPEDEPNGLIVAAPDPFEEWWAIYPRKVAKVMARKAWAQMTKQIHALTLDELMIRTRAFAAAVIHKDPEHVAHAATWLRGERWNDEIHTRSQTDGQFSRYPTDADRAAERAATRLDPMLQGAQQALARPRRWTLRS